MRVAVVGSGGREHALATSLGRTAEVVVTPGNPGIPGSTPQPVEELDVDLVVVGPETPLVEGLADRVYLLESGRIVREAAPGDLLADEALLRTYLGIG